jgi:hypothetical protein
MTSKPRGVTLERRTPLDHDDNLDANLVEFIHAFSFTPRVSNDEEVASDARAEAWERLALTISP